MNISKAEEIAQEIRYMIETISGQEFEDPDPIHTPVKDKFITRDLVEILTRVFEDES